MANKVFPIGSQNCAIESRLKKMSKWALLMLGFPLSYIMLPVSCCIRNPIAKRVQQENNDDIMFENIVIGCSGAITVVLCCGCCCGCFGKYECDLIR